MTITFTTTNLHWNYFLALERDLETLSRYIEFRNENFNVFSIELAHLLFAAASEVDVIAKLLCEQISPNDRRENINDYKAIIVPAIPDLYDTEVFIQRYGLSFKPWLNWNSVQGQNPFWWRSYNKVKHQRDAHFNEATLKHALNAMGALLVLVHQYYMRTLAPNPQTPLAPKEAMAKLKPDSNLLKLQDDWYYSMLVV